MSQTHNIRWLISHEPVDLFLRTAEEFSRDIAQRTNGRINIEVYTLTDYANKFKDGVKSDPMVLLQNKEIEMTQVQMYKLGTYSTDFFALEMPFLFDSHSHATRVLEGDIGKSILASLKTTSPATGLAFTYSGGYRVIAADKDIRTTEDLKGLEIATTTNPVEIATIEAFGCKAVPVHTGDWSAETVATRHSSQAVDTTLPRYKNEANVAVHKHVIDTKHSMFLTSIIISTDFWNSLSKEDQEAIQASALHSF
jgi:TRAP-type C4-dicarboxylate transport system substrate-binding protein